MSDIAINKARQIMPDLLKALHKEFNISFSTEISEVNGKLRIQFKQNDSGGEFMTLDDLSAMLQMERSTLRQMTEARAQQSTINPIPFIRVGRNLLFKRSEIIAWLERKQDEAAILPPVKGNIKKSKR